MKATAAQEAFCSTYGGILGQVGQFPRGFQQDRFFKEKDYTGSFQFKPFYFALVAQQKVFVLCFCYPILKLQSHYYFACIAARCFLIFSSVRLTTFSSSHTAVTVFSAMTAWPHLQKLGALSSRDLRMKLGNISVCLGSVKTRRRNDPV